MFPFPAKLKPPVHDCGGIVCLLTEVLRQIDGQRLRIDALADLISNQGTRLMSAITEFSAKQQAFNARIETAVTGIAGDVDNLTQQIRDLQNALGTLSPEDAAALQTILDSSEALASKLEALDGLTPPKVPVG